ncbi:MAG: DUF4442 domain-containing protein [Nitrospiraceae bacterium]|nr:DUF4442 domain-containing protein [Nitrospiraceae bacterium]
MAQGEIKGDVYNDVTALPFNRFIGMEALPPDSGFLVSLPAAPHYANHLGTVHASALLAVAEAGSGAFILKHLGNGDGYLTVVRRLQSKFRRPAMGRVSARACAKAGAIDDVRSDLQVKGRALFSVSVEVVDEADVVVMSADIEWFITREGR